METPKAMTAKEAIMSRQAVRGAALKALKAMKAAKDTALPALKTMKAGQAQSTRQKLLPRGSVCSQHQSLLKDRRGKTRCLSFQKATEAMKAMLQRRPSADLDVHSDGSSIA